MRVVAVGGDYIQTCIDSECIPPLHSREESKNVTQVSSSRDLVL